MTLLNPKPRFAYDTAADMIYDYVAQKDVKIVTDYVAVDGTWDLVKVKELILSGKPIDATAVGDLVTPPAPVVPPGEEIPVIPPPGGEEIPPGTDTPPPSSDHPLAWLLALALTPLQSAALGITKDQLASGVDEATVKNWNITEARAKALQLTPAQRSMLMP